jgi:isochorismate synthase
VADLLPRLQAGELEKLVLARRTLVTTGSLPAAEVLRRLEAQEGTTRFAITHGALTFLGATPERLVARRGDRLWTAALAGSAAERSGAAAELLASVKERHEHHLVVEALRQALEPLCDPLTVADVPEVRRLRHLLHLETPIEGRLRHPMHVLRLVAALHPTPAVGGRPAAAVPGLLADLEPEARGWYAAPVGWFDTDGNGDFSVALRCAVLRDGEAHLYAGAGIVADSDPGSELAETELKLGALREALGV